MAARWQIGISLVALGALACRAQAPQQSAERPLVLVYQPLGADPAPLARLLERFRQKTGREVEAQVIPNDSDVAHQYFLSALEGGSSAFDVLVVDVIWVSEF